MCGTKSSWNLLTKAHHAYWFISCSKQLLFCYISEALNHNYSLNETSDCHTVLLQWKMSFKKVHKYAHGRRKPDGWSFTNSMHWHIFPCLAKLETPFLHLHVTTTAKFPYSSLSIKHLCSTRIGGAVAIIVCCGPWGRGFDSRLWWLRFDGRERQKCSCS